MWFSSFAPTEGLVQADATLLEKKIGDVEGLQRGEKGRAVWAWVGINMGLPFNGPGAIQWIWVMESLSSIL